MASKAPYRTGFCGIGLHEGTSPVGVSGGPLKVCVFWMECSCPCHAELTKIFAMTGVERTPQQNPKWSPPKSTFKMPTVEERVLARATSNGLDPVSGVVVPPTLQRDAAGILPPVVTRSFAATPTGRSARGELEAWVREATDLWVVEDTLDTSWGVVCTPTWIAEEISKKHGVDPPSTGAVTAVLDRWQSIGFAVIARKPVRLISYTSDAMEIGLEGLKMRAKKKPGQSAALERVTAKKRS